MTNDKNIVPATSMRPFIQIWLGQVISSFGSGLSSFALGIWVYQTTKSVTSLSLVTLCATLPILLFSSVAGALVDRWDRKWVMVVSEVASVVSMGSLGIVFFLGRLEIWHIYITVFVISTFAAFRGPAYIASISLIVPPRDLSRANGMSQTAQGLASLVAPLVSGILIVSLNLGGIILIDAFTFICGLVAFLITKIPSPPKAKDGQQKQGLGEEIIQGFRYLFDRPGLLGLLVLFAINNFMVSLASLLVTPLGLSLTSADQLGLMLTLSGLGVLVGSIVMSVWRGPQRRIYMLFFFFIVNGIGLMLVGLRPSVVVATLGGFIAFLGVPIINSTAQTILHQKTAPSYQGRIFATLGMFASAMSPLAYILAGPLADNVFTPLLLPQGLLADTVGKVIGVGNGRGIGLLFIVAGVSVILITLGGFLYPKLRRIDTDLPNHIVEEAIPALSPDDLVKTAEKA